MGLQKDLAITCDITMSLEHLIEDFLVLLENNKNALSLREYNSISNEDEYDRTKIIVYGYIYYTTEDPCEFVRFFREMRFHKKIHKYVCYEVNIEYNEILVNFDSGRMIRPLLVVNN